MNAAPQVTSIRHMAALTGNTFFRVVTCFPFFISIFQKFAIQGIAVGAKLMAGRAEPGILKGVNVLSQAP